MQEFLEIISSLPTVLFTVPLALSLLYWAAVIVGAADVDLLGGAEGTLEAGGEGLAEGAVEGLAEAGAESGLAWLSGALKLRSAPVTVVGSVFSLSGWLLSFFGMAWLGDRLDGALPSWAAGGLVGVVAFVGALLLTSLAVRPLAPIFEHKTKRGGAHLVGKTCVIRSARVNARSGQAEMDDGGAGLLLHVRCPDEDNGLAKGDEALVIEYDEARDVYLVEPLRAVLGSGELDARVPRAGRDNLRVTAAGDTAGRGE